MVANTSQLRRYARIWWRLISLSFANSSASRLEFVSYVVGKLLRITFFFLFAFALVGKTNGYAGYAKGEIMLLFAVMNIIDNLLQVFYRGLTTLPRDILTGKFDFVLMKPVSPFFWTTFSLFDFFDLTTVPVTLGFFAYAIHLLPYSPSWSAWLLGTLMMIISMILAFSLNILLATLAFWKPEIESGAWLLYRDLTFVARFPVSIFPRTVQLLLTFVFPVFMIIAFPADALTGRLTPILFSSSLVMLVILLLLTRALWKRGLSRYTSASS